MGFNWRFKGLKELLWLRFQLAKFTEDIIMATTVVSVIITIVKM